MALKVIGSGEVVQQVFWLDARTRQCGVMLCDPSTGHERCRELAVADLVHETDGRTTKAGVELVLGNRAMVILGEAP